MTGGDPIRRGALYWVPDTSVALPPTTSKDRVPHPRRPFLIISNDERNADYAWPVVLGFPLTTSLEFKTEYDVAVAKGVAGLAQDSVIRVVMLQPIAKAKLTQRMGQLPASTVEECVARMLDYAGLL